MARDRVRDGRHLLTKAPDVEPSTWMLCRSLLTTDGVKIDNPTEQQWKMRVSESKYYGCGWYDKGVLIEEVRETATDKVVCRAVNHVVEFDHRKESTSA